MTTDRMTPLDTIEYAIAEALGGMDAPGLPERARHRIDAELPGLTSIALRDVMAERAKQRARWGDNHDDDEHAEESLASAASLLASPSDKAWRGAPEWAHGLRTKHRGDRRRQLVIAAALLLAEIERLDRVAASAATEGR